MASLKSNTQSAAATTAQGNNSNITRGTIDTSIVEFIQHHFLIPRELAW
jgi:hypothetical protein